MQDHASALRLYELLMGPRGEGGMWEVEGKTMGREIYAPGHLVN